jgi:hypothetical protein
VEEHVFEAGLGVGVAAETLDVLDERALAVDRGSHQQVFQHMGEAAEVLRIMTGPVCHAEADARRPETFVDH